MNKLKHRPESYKKYPLIKNLGYKCMTLTNISN